jgi:hypothetical protein
LLFISITPEKHFSEPCCRMPLRDADCEPILLP